MCEDKHEHCNWWREQGYCELENFESYFERTCTLRATWTSSVRNLALDASQEKSLRLKKQQQQQQQQQQLMLRRRRKPQREERPQLQANAWIKILNVDTGISRLLHDPSLVAVLGRPTTCPPIHLFTGPHAHLSTCPSAHRPNCPPGSMLCGLILTYSSRSGRLCSCQNPSECKISWITVPLCQHPGPPNDICERQQQW